MQTDIIDRVADRCSASGIPLTRAGVATVVGYLDEERAGYREADALVGGGEGERVHGDHIAELEVQDHA